MDEQSLQTAFDKLTGCFERGDVAGFMAGLDPGLTMFDEDSPFRLDKAGFQQHVGLLAGNMESMAFILRDTRFAVHGQTGVVDGYFDFRGKPKDGGYRIRYGRFTMALAWKNAAWTVVA
jgi:ketosteroid isomerase-like protein